MHQRHAVCNVVGVTTRIASIGNPTEIYQELFNARPVVSLRSGASCE